MQGLIRHLAEQYVIVAMNMYLWTTVYISLIVATNCAGHVRMIVDMFVVAANIRPRNMITVIAVMR